MNFRVLNQLRAATLELLRPAPPIPLSRWASENIYLPSGLSEVPGRINLWSYQRGILDAVLDPECERISVMKAARCGYSTILAAITGYYVKVEPSSILAVLPVDADARNFMVQQIESVFAVSPSLKDAISSPHTGRNDRSTILFRPFPGGSLRVVSARSPRNLRAHSARILLLDEVDGFDPTQEGDAIALAERRTAGYGSRRILCGSTPTDSDSAIAARYSESDSRVFECPCPSCSAWHEIRWADIRWPEGRPEEAQWCCPSCGVLHSDHRYKAGMVAAGRWRVTRPEVRGHAGFRLSALVSLHPPAAWPLLAAEFVAAAKRPELLRVFVNTVLGEVWRDDDEQGPQPGDLRGLCEPFNLDSLPPEVLYVFGGCDLQGDRLELTTLGLTADDQWLILAHEVVIGSPRDSDAPWRDLSELLRRRFQSRAGRPLGYDAVGLDVGDGNVMDKALQFAAGERGAVRIVPLKGQAGWGRPPLSPTASKRTRSLMIAGVDPIKQQIYDRINKQIGVRFSLDLTDNYLSQLLSEHVVVKYSKGRPTRRWERYPGKLAEALDCLVYCLCAKAAVAINAVRRQDELAGRPVAPVMPTVIRSAWLEATSRPRY
ncbi:MAG TPA: terminase gpA endonuclease subunit [Stellaceae bacterium]|nr:terminase gpA endonuclease subunit [Stellaceae bacterium]